MFSKLISDDEFARRLREAKSARRSDCIGTALYLVGMQDEDRILETRDIYGDILSKLPAILESQSGCLVAWERSLGENGVYVAHMGVVVSLNPTRVTHRKYSHGPIIESEPLDAACGHHIQSQVDTYYYKPRKIDF